MARTLSRRSFLTRGSLVVAAGGVGARYLASALFLQATESDAPEISGVASRRGNRGGRQRRANRLPTSRTSSPGEISLYQGERQFTLNDRAMAAKLFRSAR